MNAPTYTDRFDAGRRLAESLDRFRRDDPLILALPRGGVQVGFEVARALDAPLDVLIVRKLRSPVQPELAIGAVAGSDPPVAVLDRAMIDRLGITDEYLRAERREQEQQVRRQQDLYRAGRGALAITDRTVIVVDDGVATGSTVRAALQALRHAEPRRLILAVPVGSPDTIRSLSREADEVICPLAPVHFHAVGEFYERFDQTSDHEVVDLLARDR